MDNHLKNLCIIILLAISFISPHQNFLFAESLSDEDKLNKKFLINFKNDFAEVLVSPASWKGKDFFNLSAVLAAGFLLYAVDQDIHQWFQENRSSSSDDIFEFITHVGDGEVLAGLIAALYVSGELSHNNSLRKTALLSLESLLTTGIIVSSLKFTIGRARSGTGESSHTFFPFSLKSGNHSFPSGHASAAFAVATTIACQSKNTYVDIIAYSLATLVAISRVHNNNHWPSDVLVGSSIGYFVAKKISALDKKRNSGKVMLNFQLSRQRQAFSLSVVF